MPAENPPGRLRALEPLRAQLSSLKRWLEARSARARWLLGGLALAALVMAGYWAVPSDAVEWQWLYGGRQCDPDELLKITTILITEGIPVQTDHGRVEVPRERLQKAQAALNKLGAGPHSYKEMLDEPFRESIFESPAEAQLRRQRREERKYEAAIQQIDGALSATVSLWREPQRGARVLDQRESVHLTAILRYDDDRRIPPKTIDSIHDLLIGLVPNLKADGLKLVGSKGHVYLDGANPTSITHSRAQVDEEELENEITARLNWIEGVRVSVKVDVHAPLPVAEKPVPPGAPLVVPNAPLELAAEPVSSAAEHARPGAAGVVSRGKARVLVQVPIDYFQGRFRARDPEHEPSPVELRRYVNTIEKRIETTVAHVIPAEELGDLKIESIDVGGSGRLLTSPPAETGRGVPWWVQAMVGGTIAACAVLGGLLVMAWRPVVRSRVPFAGTSSRRSRFDVGQAVASGPGPAERVRELVRKNPAVAAGVLQRWIGQGGDGP
jgi:flagellar biosynthesis/type III secretory pathway M-ring protein FliF/YscJ